MSYAHTKHRKQNMAVKRTSETNKAKRIRKQLRDGYWAPYADKERTR